MRSDACCDHSGIERIPLGIKDLSEGQSVGRVGQACPVFRGAHDSGPFEDIGEPNTDVEAVLVQVDGSRSDHGVFTGITPPAQQCARSLLEFRREEMEHPVPGLGHCLPSDVGGSVKEFVDTVVEA